MKVRLQLVSFFCLLFFFSSTSAQAAFFKFEPENKTAEPGQRVEVKINIDTEGESPTVADAVVIFNSTKLHLVEVVEPSADEKFFPKFLKKISENKVYVGGAIDPGTTAKPGRGVLGKLIFEVPESGSASLTFACEAGKSTDSNISLKNSARIVVDLLDCSKINTSTIAASGASGATATPTIRLSTSPNPQLTGGTTPTLTPRLTTTITLTPTPTLTPTLSLTLPVSASPTPAKLPVSGSVSGSSMLIKAGIIFAISGLIIKYFISLR